MSYHKDKDAYTRGVGAIAAIDHSRMRQRQRQRVAMRSAAHDAKMGRVAMFGGLGMVDVNHLTGHVRAGTTTTMEGGSWTNPAGGAPVMTSGIVGSSGGGIVNVGGRATPPVRVTMAGATRSGGGVDYAQPKASGPGLASGGPDVSGPTTPTGGSGATTLTDPPLPTSTASGGAGGGISSGGAWVDPTVPPADTSTITATDDTGALLTADTSILGKLANLSMGTKVVLGAAVAGGIYYAFFRKKRR